MFEEIGLLQEGELCAIALDYGDYCAIAYRDYEELLESADAVQELLIAVKKNYKSEFLTAPYIVINKDLSYFLYGVEDE